ncbi:hypothetical protein BH18VER1_BH18VER1_09200 [soil metagenome]
MPGGNWMSRSSTESLPEMRRGRRRSRNPEDVLGFVFVGIFGISSGFFGQLRMFLLEAVGNVSEKNETEDGMLVIGRIHVAAQLVRGEPELGFEAEIGGGVVLRAGGAGHGDWIFLAGEGVERKAFWVVRAAREGPEIPVAEGGEGLHLPHPLRFARGVYVFPYGDND